MDSACDAAFGSIMLAPLRQLGELGDGQAGCVLERSVGTEQQPVSEGLANPSFAVKRPISPDASKGLSEDLEFAQLFEHAPTLITGPH